MCSKIVVKFNRNKIFIGSHFCTGLVAPNKVQLNKILPKKVPLKNLLCGILGLFILSF